jgi:hypothetical protein
MKALKYLIAIAALMGALTMSAKADLKFLGFQAFDNPNNAQHNLEVLAAFLNADPSGFTHIGTDAENIGGQDTLLNVTPGSFIVAHYGGPGGGSYEFFQVINGETQVTVPGDPNPADDLANQNSLSSARQFAGPPGVPDGGMTVALLGIAFVGLEGLRRKLHARKL